MKYKVKREAIPFPLENGLTLKETVIVTIVPDIQEEEPLELRYGYGDMEVMRSICDRWTDFKGVYFKDFNIHSYCRLLEMEDEYTVSVFQAERCFFDGKSDFSMTTYGKGGFSLSHSYFGNDTVSFQDCVFEAEITSFSANIYGDGSKVFAGTKFYGKEVHFYSSRFGQGEIDFKCSFFEQANLNFSGCTFGNGTINFDFSHFGRRGVDFSGVDFGSGDATFRNCSFNGGRALYFGSALKHGKLSFSRSEFGDGDIDFSFCNLTDSQVHFKYSRLGHGNFNMDRMTLEGGEILFKGINFVSQSMQFLESKITLLIFENCTLSEHVNMQLSYCEDLEIRNCIIEKTFDMLFSELHKIDIRTMNLTSTKNLGRIYIDWSLNDVKRLIYSQKGTTKDSDKANQFRLLKENFHEIGQYDDEDFAYVEFKRCQSRAILKGEDLPGKKIGSFKMLLRYILFPIKWFIFDFIGRYATNPIRILGALLINIMIFSGVYTLPGIQLGGFKAFYDNRIINRYANGLYHSIQSTFTLGYGDINPGNMLTLLVSGMESFVGVFLMSYFTAAFVRKLLR